MKHLYRSELEKLTNSARVSSSQAGVPMDEAARSAQIVRFGVFEADLQTGELHKNGLKVPLQGQPFQVCAILLEHAGKLVTREELRQKVWPEDTFVDFDHAQYGNYQDPALLGRRGRQSQVCGDSSSPRLSFHRLRGKAGFASTLIEDSEKALRET